MTRKRIYKMEWRIYLMQEAPSVGSGWRGVAVIKEGYKWVYLIETATEIKFKLLKSVWDGMRGKVPIKKNRPIHAVPLVK